MDLVTRIKEKCSENGTNIATLEKELNIGNGVVRRWNERNPGAYHVHKIAERLNVSVEWLLTGKENADLSPEEQKLIDLYRHADERGKRSIMRSAEAENMELESSDSKIG